MVPHEFVDDVAEWDLNNTGVLSEDLEVWFQRFLNKNPYRKKKISKKTKKDYGDAFSTFMLFAQQYDGKLGIKEITSRFINRYLIAYQEKLAKSAYDRKKITKEEYREVLQEGKKKQLGMNDSDFTVFERFENSMSQRLVVIKALFAFITRENKQLHDFMPLFGSVVKIKISTKLTPHLASKELLDLVSLMENWPERYKQYAPKSSIYYAWRNSALIILYALSGARTTELLNVRLRDMKLSKDDDGDEYISLNILKGKGNKKRQAIIVPKHFSRHYEHLQSVLPDDSFYISSVTKNGQIINSSMSDKSIRDFFNKVMGILGLDRSGLHTARRAYVSKRIGVDNANASVVAKEVGNTVAVLEEHYLKADEAMLVRAKKGVK